MLNLAYILRNPILKSVLPSSTKRFFYSQMVQMPQRGDLIPLEVKLLFYVPARFSHPTDLLNEYKVTAGSKVSLTKNNVTQDV